MSTQKNKYNKPTMRTLGKLIQVTQGDGSKPGDAGNLTIKTGGGN